MDLPPSSRVRVRRESQKGRYDRVTIDAILDDGFLCHVGVVQDDQPFVVPTGYVRDGDRILIHGSAASRMLNTAKAPVPVCVTVTHVDGVVLARSAFNSSINYRSVMILGEMREVTEREDKLTALRMFTDHLVPGRWDDARRVKDKELKATSVLSLDLTEASAKLRSGPPDDPDEDLDEPVWAGIVPLITRAGDPVADPSLRSGVELPAYLSPPTVPGLGEG